MPNTVKTTNRTIEVSSIDSNYMMTNSENVESVVFIPGAADDVVEIIESSIETTDPVKVKLQSGDGEPRVWYCHQNLTLGFTFANGTFTAGSKVIFNIGVRNY
jgi:hypothetical protein